MQLKIDGTTYDGEMSLMFIDEQNQSTCVKISLTLPCFMTEITEIRSPIGIFKNTTLTHIAIGTKDSFVAYQLETIDFCLDSNEITKMLVANKEGDPIG